MPLNKVVFDRLPPAAGILFAELSQEKDEALAVSRLAQDQLADKRGYKNQHEQDLRRVSQSNPRIENIGSRIAALTAVVDADIREMKTMQDQADARAFRWQQIGHLVNALENYVGNIAGGEISPFKETVKKPEPRGDVLVAVEACRLKVRELGADLAAIASAPIFGIVVKQNVRLQIEALAARGEPSVYGMIEHGGGIDWPMIKAWDDNPEILRGLVHGHPVPPARAVGFDALSFYVWHQRDSITAALERMVDECADDANALSDPERRKRRSATLNEILKLERDEEFLIRWGKTKSVIIPRRPEADPRAVLDLASELPEVR